MLSWMATAMVVTAIQQSPINDEPVYVAAAVAYDQRGSLQVNPEHPPLTKILIAVGLQGADVHLDPAYKIGLKLNDQWTLGRTVLYESGNDTDRMLLWARLPSIVLTLLFGLVVFFFARDLFGDGGGLLALALFTLSPDLIAHGSVAANDVPVAGFILTTAWLLWRARNRPKLYLPLAGAAFGCALASKMSALSLFPVVLVLAGWSMWYASSAPTRRRLLHAAGAVALVGAIAVAVVWITYLVVDPSLNVVVEPRFRPSSRLKRLVLKLMPFPKPYTDGLSIQLKFEGNEYKSYLFGEISDTARWYYLPVALAVKEPLGMLGAWLVGLAAFAVHRMLRPMVPYVLLMPAVLLGVAMTGSRDLGVRYVVWLPMFMAVAAGAVVVFRRRRVAIGAMVALVAFTAFSTVRAFPYYLPYSNEAFGGPSQTYRYLGDSNVDWGQDMRRLGQYLGRTAPGEPVWLMYYGPAVPGYYGVNARNLKDVPVSDVHGLVAVSVHLLATRKDQYTALLADAEPITTIGHTIKVYRLP